MLQDDSIASILYLRHNKVSTGARTGSSGLLTSDDLSFPQLLTVQHAGREGTVTIQVHGAKASGTSET